MCDSAIRYFTWSMSRLGMLFVTAVLPCMASARLKIAEEVNMYWSKRRIELPLLSSIIRMHVNAASVKPRRRIRVFLCCAVLSLAGCASGSGGNSMLPPPPKPEITVQPLDQTVPLGQTATFSVTATGEGNLTYQWSENGQAITGAIGPSYTTPPLVLGANGSPALGTFQVTVSNLYGSVMSNSATLTAGPRSPKPGDLRYLLFRQVNLPGLLNESNSQNTGTMAEPTNDVEVTKSPAVGSPLSLGSNFDCGDNICSWQSAVQFLPPPMTGLKMYYLSGLYSSFASDVRPLTAPNDVIISLDFEPAFNYYAVAMVQTSQPGGFDYRMQVVSPSQVQATVEADGQESRIVTALSFGAAGNVHLISYGWTGDTTTVYGAQTEFVPPGSNVVDAVLTEAKTLATDGYFISAFGGNDTDGYLLVGMRVRGDRLPRSVELVTPAGNEPASFSLNVPYFTTVIFLKEIGAVAAVNER